MKIYHFTVVGLVTWPLNGNEAGVDLVLIKTSLLLLCKSSLGLLEWYAVHRQEKSFDMRSRTVAWKH